MTLYPSERTLGTDVTVIDEIDAVLRSFDKARKTSRMNDEKEVKDPQNPTVTPT
jgi:hypothetical protein